MKISAPIQTGPGAHLASYTMGTWSFPGVKQLGHGIDHPPTSSVEVKERIELYIYSTSGPSWPVTGRTLSPTITFMVDEVGMAADKLKNNRAIFFKLMVLCIVIQC